MAHRGAEFLKKLHPNGPWTVTAIEVDSPGIKTATFVASEYEELSTWLAMRDGEANLYYSVNTVIKPTNKKPDRESIKEVSYFHVDIDPRVGEDLVKERIRILAMLGNPPPGVPPPTVILFSGGGYQALWKLRDPIAINGDLEKAEDAKLYNLQLEQLLGGDSCHDISRILRIPSWNIPNERKRKKGREKVEARVVLFLDEIEYSVSDFDKAQPIQIEERSAPGLVAISGNIERPVLDNLPVSEEVKTLIQTGGTDYESRSEALFAVCCALVRAGCDDDSVYSIITDPAYKISASVLEKGSASEKYAIRQIGRAKEKAIHPKLAEMNDKFALIRNLGGQCVLVREYKDRGRTTTSVVKVRAFKDAYCNERVEVGQTKEGTPVTKTVADWWMGHEQRRSYERIVFEPGRETTKDYNLWTGYAVELRPMPGTSDRFLKHVFENVCNGNTEHYEYLMNWLARTVQQPGKLGECAVVLRGEEGVGKTFFANAFGRLFGRHYMKISQPSHLVGNFNGHMQDCVVLFVDEGFYAGDKKHAGVLKDLVTGESLTIERKGVDVIEMPNYLHVIMASNSAWVVPAGPNARRYFVLDVSPGHMQDSGYFGAIAADMERGGYSDLLYTLMQRDIANFDVRVVPKTKALEDQQEYSRAPEENWWFDKLNEGGILTTDNGWNTKVVFNDMYENYYEDARKHRYENPLSKRAFAIALQKMCPSVKKTWVGTKTRRQMAYELPALKQCRIEWDKYTRAKGAWDADDLEPDQQQRGVF